MNHRRLAAVSAALALPALAHLAHAQSSTRPPSRTGAIVEALHRSGAVPRCWNAYLHAQPDSSSVRFRVRVEVTDRGSVQRVVVLDPAPPVLVGCVQTQLRQVTVAEGEAATVETTYAFAAGSPAPVPQAPPPSSAPPAGSSAPPAGSNPPGSSTPPARR